MTVLSLFLALLLQAQDFRSSVSRAGGPYHVYEVADSSRTPAPDGYTPLYVSHFSRHGSRYLLEGHVTAARDLLKGADLTEEGRRLRAAVDSVYALQKGNTAALTAVGAGQHKGIGMRLARACPEVFASGRTVKAAASSKARCRSSMEAFLSGLRSASPGFPVRTRSGLHLMLRYSCHGGEDRAARKSCQKYLEQKTSALDASGFTARYFQASPAGAQEVMREIFLYAADVQDIGEGPDLFRFFTEEEIQALYELENVRSYTENFGSGDFGIIRKQGARRVLREIVRDADRALEKGDVAADLRFGHDSGLGPVAALIGLVGSFPAEEAGERFLSWKDICMASNLQLIFYRNGDGDVLVKILYNETERLLPGLSGGPYYPWKELRAYLLGI